MKTGLEFIIIIIITIIIIRSFENKMTKKNDYSVIFKLVLANISQDAPSSFVIMEQCLSVLLLLCLINLKYVLDLLENF